MDFLENNIVLSELLSENKVIHGFSTKPDGNMSYDRDHQHQAEKNIHAFFAALGLNLADNCLIKLPVKNSANIALLNKPTITGRHVLKENDPAIERKYENRPYSKPTTSIDEPNKIFKGFDAGISKAQKTFIGVLPADCAPVMIYDPLKKYYALIHAGRMGLEYGIVFKTIYMCRTILHSKPQDLLCYIGPHICHSCYRPDGKNYQLAKVIKTQLKMLGVKKIENSRYCTYHHDRLFFSNARAKGNKEEGRHLAIIGKK